MDSRKSQQFHTSAGGNANFVVGGGQVNKFVNNNFMTLKLKQEFADGRNSSPSVSKSLNDGVNPLTSEDVSQKALHDATLLAANQTISLDS
jgi:hypothetical protein